MAREENDNPEHMEQICTKSKFYNWSPYIASYNCLKQADFIVETQNQNDDQTNEK